MGEKTAFAARLAGFFKTGDRKVKIITVLGLAGILLIFLSQFIGNGKTASKAEPVQAEDSVAYTAALQEQLSALIEQIEGAGKTTVLVTLQNDWETLYVSEEKTNRDSTWQSSGEGTVSERQTKEESYVLVDGTNGRSALVRTRMEPVPPGAASGITFTPASLPERELRMLPEVSLTGFFMSITDTAPVRSALRCTE